MEFSAMVFDAGDKTFGSDRDRDRRHVLEKNFFHLTHIHGSRDPQKSYPSEISAI